MVYKLSLKEKKLLNEISLNCRQPISQLAKRIGLSKQGTNYMLKKLIRDKVILGFYPVVNIMNLDYYYTRFFVKFINMTDKSMESLLRWLDVNTNWYLKTDGVYDIVVSAWSRSFDDFKNKVNYFSDRFSDKIDDRRESLCIELVQFKDRYIYDDGTREKIILRKTNSFEPDELDKKILRILDKNSRIPTVKITEETGASPKKIISRIRRMERENVLLGYRPQINISLLGYSFYKVFFSFNKFKKNEIGKFRAYLESKPETLYMQYEIGKPDLDVELILGVNQDFFQFMRDLIYKFPGFIKKYEFVLVEKESSVSYLPVGF